MKESIGGLTLSVTDKAWGKPVHMVHDEFFRLEGEVELDRLQLLHSAEVVIDQIRAPIWLELYFQAVSSQTNRRADVRHT